MCLRKTQVRFVALVLSAIQPLHHKLFSFIISFDLMNRPQSRSSTMTLSPILLSIDHQEARPS